MHIDYDLKREDHLYNKVMGDLRAEFARVDGVTLIRLLQGHVERGKCLPDQELMHDLKHLLAGGVVKGRQLPAAEQ